MKIEYSPTDSSYATLVDESTGGVIKRFNPTATVNAVQTENLAAMPTQQTAQFRQPVGNISETLELEVAVTYASRQAAVAASRTVITSIIGLTLFWQVTEGTEVQKFKNGTVKKLNRDVQGATVTYVFTIEADLVST